jgi:hypothetical protein
MSLHLWDGYLDVRFSVGVYVSDDVRFGVLNILQLHGHISH